MTKKSPNVKSIVPMYKQIANYLFDQLRKGEYGAGGLMESEREISEKFNVNRHTVRRAFDILVSEKLVARKPGQGTFVHYKPSHELKPHKPRRNNIVIVTTAVRERFYSIEVFYKLMLGAERYARSHGYNISVIFGEEEPEMINVPEIMKNNPPDGAILVGVQDEKTIAQFGNLPIVLASHYLDNVNTNCVLEDNYQGIRIAFEYLYNLGHRNIGFVCPVLDRIAYKERYYAYRNAVSSYGLKYEKTYIKKIDVKDLIDTFLSGNSPKATAIIAVNDILAIQCMNIFKSRGKLVPKHISIIGFDDNKEGMMVSPTLTTIRAPREEMGAAAVKKLIEVIKGGNGLQIKIVVPVNLVERQSCVSVKIG